MSKSDSFRMRFEVAERYPGGSLLQRLYEPFHEKTNIMDSEKCINQISLRRLIRVDTFRIMGIEV